MWGFSGSESNFFSVHALTFFDPTGDPTKAHLPHLLKNAFKFYKRDPSITINDLTMRDMKLMLIDFFSAIPNINNCRSLIKPKLWQSVVVHFAQTVVAEMMIRHGNATGEFISQNEFFRYFFHWFAMTDEYLHVIKIHGLHPTVSPGVVHVASPFQPEDMLTKLSMEETAEKILTPFIKQHNVGYFYEKALDRGYKIQQKSLSRKPFERTTDEARSIYELIKGTYFFSRISRYV